MKTSPAIPRRSRSPPAEIAYLCDAVSEWFRHPVTPADVVWTYAGVRPLRDDGATEGAGSDARLRAGTDRYAARAERVRRQDHDVSPPRRGGDGSSGAVVSRPETALDGRRLICPAAISPGTGSRRCATIWSRRYPFLPLPMATRLTRAYGTHAPGCTGRRALPGRSRHRTLAPI